MAKKTGFKCTRTATRFPFKSRWGKENLELVQSAPWRKYKEDKDGDVEISDGLPKEERDREHTLREAAEERGKFVDVSEKAPRDVYITYEDAKRFNQFTRGCPGCSS